MTLCESLHEWARALPRFRFPFDAALIPKNGLYLLFQKGERGHGGERIVRVGTHTGVNQLRSRLKQHFITPNKDRSIFRKNIGRALLARDDDPYAPVWEIDCTSLASRALHGSKVDPARQAAIEKEVSRYIQDNFSFVTLRADGKEDRLRLESRIISTVSLCEDCGPSKGWLGNFSPKEKIRESGLWLVNELYREPLSGAELAYLKNAVL